MVEPRKGGRKRPTATQERPQGGFPEPPVHH